jgi:hypothetical protein
MKIVPVCVEVAVFDIKVAEPSGSPITVLVKSATKHNLNEQRKFSITRNLK